MKLVEFLKPTLGIGTICEKPIILGLSEGQTDRPVPFFRRMRYSRHGCLDVWRMLWVMTTVNISQLEAVFNTDSCDQQNPLQSGIFSSGRGIGGSAYSRAFSWY